MKKILIAAALVAWAGTLYGAYMWGSNKGPSNSMVAAAETRATMCSMTREVYKESNRALDKDFTLGTTTLPLRAWGRAYPDSTNSNLKALAEEAAFQENRLKAASDGIPD